MTVARAPSNSEAPFDRRRGLIPPPLAKDAPVLRRGLRNLERLGRGLAVHDALRIAPAMAYHFFLSLLPLLVFVGYVVGAVVRRRGVEAALAPLLDALPAAAEAVVTNEAQRLGTTSALGPLAAVGFLWVASGGMHGLMNAVEGMVGARRRPWWKKRVMAVGWVVAALVAVTLSASGLIAWDELSTTVEGTPSAVRVAHPTPPPALASALVLSPPLPSSAAGRSSTSVAPRAFPRRRGGKLLRTGGRRAVALGFSMVGAVIGLAAFYRLSVSHSKRIKRRVLPGALLAVSLFIVISWGFGLYVKTLAGYAAYYGSLAAVAVLLVWLWLTSLTILVGAELNTQLEGIRD